MRAVRDIVLDLKGSLATPSRSSPSKIPVSTRLTESRKANTMDKSGKDEIDASSVSSAKPTDTGLDVVHDLQNKHFEMLEKLHNKLDDISKRLQSNTVNHEPSLSRGSVRDNGDRLNSPEARSRQIYPNRLPQGTHDISYNHIGGEQNVDEVRQWPSNVDDCEVIEDYNDTFTATKLNTRQLRSVRANDDFRDPPCNVGGGQHVNDNHLNQRHCNCDDCLNARDNRVLPRDNCVNARENENAARNIKFRPARVYADKPSSDVNILSVNHHRGSSFNHQGKEDMKSTFLIDEDIDGSPSRRQVDLNDSVKPYHDKFDEIGEQINDLTSHMKECKVNEEKRLREETLKKQKLLVKTLEERIETLSSKIEENEKKDNLNLNDINAPSANACVVSCPVCGRGGTHQHDSYIFNGNSIIEPVSGSTVTNPLNSLRPNNVEFRQGNTTIKPSNAGRLNIDPRMHR